MENWQTDDTIGLGGVYWLLFDGLRKSLPIVGKRGCFHGRTTVVMTFLRGGGFDNLNLLLRRGLIFLCGYFCME